MKMGHDPRCRFEIQQPLAYDDAKRWALWLLGSRDLSAFAGRPFSSRSTLMSGRIEDKLNQMDLSLPTAPEAVGYYVPVTRLGNLVITSGQLPMGGKEV